MDERLEEDDEDRDEGAAEPQAYFCGVGEGDGDADQCGEGEDGEEDLKDVVLDPPDEEAGDVPAPLFGFFDQATEDEDGADFADVEEGWEAEKEGGEKAGGEAG